MHFLSFLISTKEYDSDDDFCGHSYNNTFSGINVGILVEGEGADVMSNMEMGEANGNNCENLHINPGRARSDEKRENGMN